MFEFSCSRLNLIEVFQKERDENLRFYAAHHKAVSGTISGQLFQKYSYLHEASMQSIKLLLMLETSQITKVAKSLMFPNL